MRLKEDISEKELLEGCLRDERQYQELLYRRYADQMYNIALSYSSNDDDACDILQEGFIGVFRNLHKFRGECELGGWIRRIVVNVALEKFRKARREEEIMREMSGELREVSFDGILENINAEQLVRMVNELPMRAAMVLKLYAIEGYEHKEIAEKMGITVGTSKSQLNRARFLLKDIISSNGG